MRYRNVQVCLFVVQSIVEAEELRSPMSTYLLTGFGLLAVGAMIYCYTHEHRGHGYVLGFAISCLLGSAYGFLQGAWPFGIAEAFWGVIAYKKWTRLKAYVLRHPGTK